MKQAINIFKALYERNTRSINRPMEKPDYHEATRDNYGAWKDEELIVNSDAYKKLFQDVLNDDFDAMVKIAAGFLHPKIQLDCTCNYEPSDEAYGYYYWTIHAADCACRKINNNERVNMKYLPQILWEAMKAFACLNDDKLIKKAEKEFRGSFFIGDFSRFAELLINLLEDNKDVCLYYEPQTRDAEGFQKNDIGRVKYELYKYNAACERAKTIEWCNFFYNNTGTFFSIMSGNMPTVIEKKVTGWNNYFRYRKMSSLMCKVKAKEYVFNDKTALIESDIGKTIKNSPLRNIFGGVHDDGIEQLSGNDCDKRMFMFPVEVDCSSMRKGLLQSKKSFEIAIEKKKYPLLINRDRDSFCYEYKKSSHAVELFKKLIEEWIKTIIFSDLGNGVFIEEFVLENDSMRGGNTPDINRDIGRTSTGQLFIEYRDYCYLNKIPMILNGNNVFCSFEYSFEPPVPHVCKCICINEREEIIFKWEI